MTHSQIPVHLRAPDAAGAPAPRDLAATAGWPGSPEYDASYEAHAHNMGWRDSLGPRERDQADYAAAHDALAIQGADLSAVFAHDDPEPASAPAPSRCDLHASAGVITDMAAAHAEVALFGPGGLGSFYAHRLSMGGGGPGRGTGLGPACCPAAAHARFLLASAFRQAGVL